MYDRGTRARLDSLCRPRLRHYGAKARIDGAKGRPSAVNETHLGEEVPTLAGLTDALARRRRGPSARARRRRTDGDAPSSSCREREAGGARGALVVSQRLPPGAGRGFLGEAALQRRPFLSCLRRESREEQGRVKADMVVYGHGYSQPRGGGHDAANRLRCEPGYATDLALLLLGAGAAGPTLPSCLGLMLRATGRAASAIGRNANIFSRSYLAAVLRVALFSRLRSACRYPRR